LLIDLAKVKRRELCSVISKYYQLVAKACNWIKTKPTQLQLVGATNRKLYILSANNKYTVGG
jgi:hypothetical protein